MSRWKLKTSRGGLEASVVAKVFAKFRKYVYPHRWKISGAFAAALVTVAAQIAVPWPIKVIFDYILTDKMNPSWITRSLSGLADSATAALPWVCGAILVIALVDSIFAYLRDVLLAQTGQRVVGKIRQDLFRHLQTLPPDVYEKHRTGDLLMRLTGDIQMLRQMLVNATITAGQAFLMIVAMIGVMFWLNPKLALLGVSTVPIILIASWRISKQIRKATKSQREKESEVATIAHDVLGAMSIVQAFNREATEQKRFTRQNRSSIRAGVKTTRLQAKLYRIVALASAAAVCLILYFGVRSVLLEQMTAGDLLVFVSYLRALNKPMRQIAKLTSQVAKATSCGQRVAAVFAIQPTIIDRDDAVSVSQVRGEIEFDNVGFRYKPSAPLAVADVNFRIEAGERIAVVGHSGAGKSTLAKLLLRFYDPTSGLVRLDGMDVRQYTTESLRMNIGWVHQDTVLFGMTIGENIALGRPEASAAEIEKAAQLVRADEFIDKLPEGYDTHLGQGGTTLSGGQRQRIALARALLRQPAILMLDEPATGLDAASKRIIEEAWLAPDNKATTIVICHRLTHMDRFDRIIVLDHGALVETGTAGELLAAGGIYAEMSKWDHQAHQPSKWIEHEAC
ncbi:MAG: ABC transporter ATP-binding protein [Planctomycetota bacterium]|jgi:ABC-type multidrug transport system fused ATPase/permease subunit